MDWYYAREGKRFGPVDRAELLRLAASGELRPSDLVWNSLGQQWVLASTIPNLFIGPAPLTPPAPVRTPTAGRGCTPNRDLTRMARESLTNHWGIAIGFMVLLTIIQIAAVVLLTIIQMAAGAVPGVGFPAELIIAAPFLLGAAVFFLTLIRGAEPQIAQLFVGFNRFGTALGAYLLLALLVFLWMLLLIIPGIIAALSYTMTFYVISDNPGIGPYEAIKKSNEMMYGYRWKYFCLMLRFLGWALLCILTYGVGFLWLIPYMQTSKAHFYEDVRPRPV